MAKRIAPEEFDERLEAIFPPCKSMCDTEADVAYNASLKAARDALIADEAQRQEQIKQRQQLHMEEVMKHYTSPPAMEFVDDEAAKRIGTEVVKHLEEALVTAYRTNNSTRVRVLVPHELDATDLALTRKEFCTSHWWDSICEWSVSFYEEYYRQKTAERHDIATSMYALYKKELDRIFQFIEAAWKSVHVYGIDMPQYLPYQSRQYWKQYCITVHHVPA